MNQTVITDYFTVEKKPLLLFKHNNLIVKYDDDNDSFGIYTTNTLRRGTLIIFEKGIIGYRNKIIDYLVDNPSVSDELYPRTPDACYKDKAKHNVWGWYEKKDNTVIKPWEALFPFISKINHRCNPNAEVKRYVKRKDLNKYQGYFAVYITRTVNSGEEIFVSYGDDAGHGNTTFNWKCPCKLTDKERKRLFERNVKYRRCDYQQYF